MKKIREMLEEEVTGYFDHVGKQKDVIKKLMLDHGNKMGGNFDPMTFDIDEALDGLANNVAQDPGTFKAIVKAAMKSGISINDKDFHDKAGRLARELFNTFNEGEEESEPTEDSESGLRL